MSGVGKLLDDLYEQMDALADQLMKTRQEKAGLEAQLAEANGKPDDGDEPYLHRQIRALEMKLAEAEASVGPQTNEEQS